MRSSTGQNCEEKDNRASTYCNNCQLNALYAGMGKLYIAEARVSWVGIQGQGFSLEYPHVAMHAVSRDLTQFHQVSYCRARH